MSYQAGWPYGPGGHGYPPGWPSPAGYHPAGYYPAPWMLPQRRRGVDAAHLLGTVAVVAIIAVVVLGGIVVNASLVAPSAGTLDLGGVSITAASGWVLVPADSDATGQILQKGDARLEAFIAAQGSDLASGTLLDAEIGSIQDDSDTASASFGAIQQTDTNGYATSDVTFSAMIRTDVGSGTVDGEIYAVVLGDDGVVVEAAAPQGDLGYATGDIATMVRSLRLDQ